MKITILKIAVFLTAALGFLLGYRLAGMSDIRPHQLLNILGLLYNLLAVLVLSEVLVSNANWKRFCVEWIAPILLWSFIALPGGAILGTILEWLLHRGPSAYTVGLFAFGNMLLMSVYSGWVLEHAVVLPRPKTSNPAGITLGSFC